MKPVGFQEMYSLDFSREKMNHRSLFPFANMYTYSDVHDAAVKAVTVTTMLLLTFYLIKEY